MNIAIFQVNLASFVFYWRILKNIDLIYKKHLMEIYYAGAGALDGVSSGVVPVVASCG